MTCLSEIKEKALEAQNEIRSAFTAPEEIKRERLSRAEGIQSRLQEMIDDCPELDGIRPEFAEYLCAALDEQRLQSGEPPEIDVEVFMKKAKSNQAAELKTTWKPN